VEDLERLGQQIALGKPIGEAVQGGVEDTRLTISAEQLGAFGCERALK